MQKVINPTYEAIKALFHLVPKREGWYAPKYVEYGIRDYRGKRRYVAGYSYSRVGAHYASGVCYHRIIGYGETQEAAIAMMRQKLEALAHETKKAEA